VLAGDREKSALGLKDFTKRNRKEKKKSENLKIIEDKTTRINLRWGSEGSLLTLVGQWS